MNQEIRSRAWLSILLVGLVILLAAWRALRAQGPVVPTTPPFQPYGTESGLRIQLDPSTGQRAALPAKGGVTPAIQPIPSMHEGLVEEPGTTPAGGFKVVTQGRFHSETKVRLDAQGRIQTDCVDAAAAPRR